MAVGRSSAEARVPSSPSAKASRAPATASPMALVPLAPIHPPDRQPDAPVIEAQRGAQGAAITGGEPIADRVRHDDNPFWRDRRPSEDTGPRMTRYAQYEIGRFQHGAAQRRWL